MDELLAEFISETQETLEALAGEVVAWEIDPGDRERLDAIFRFFHTVKGSCGFLNLPRFERLSHAAEDVLSDIRAGRRTADPQTVNAVLSIMDRIGELAQAVAAGTGLPMENDEILIDALLQAGGVNGAASSPQRSALATSGEPRQASLRTIRLPLRLIDQMMNGVSDMVLARNELSRKLRERDADPELEGAFGRLSACVADMRDAISKTRMQRVERLFAAIPRMVRDLGRELGKSIDLSLEGGDVEMDREMVEMVIDPLTHIVRNSIDHGIETPEQRRAAGKPEKGSLRIAARQSGNQIVIDVRDDGRGIDTDRLVARALAAGMLDRDEVARLDEAAKLELIFRPGLSTAADVTAISGRGVGMDVVRANVERIGGLITLENRLGSGLRISLRVPLTLTIIPGLILTAGGQQFAIPRAAVVEILHDTNDMLTIHQVGGASIATVRDVRYSMIDLEDVLHLERQEQRMRTIILVRSSTGILYALGVASVENHEELVIRPAVPLVMASGVYAGMTLPDSGQPMLLLDAGGIARAAQISAIPEQEQALAQKAAAQSDAPETVSALRFREPGGRERLIALSLVDRVEEVPAARFGSSRGHPFVHIEERLIPLAGEGKLPDGDQVAVLRLRDGTLECCYPVSAVMDIVQMPLVPEMKVGAGLVAGVTVIDGAHLEVLDPFALFAALRQPGELPAAGKESIRCFVAADDLWAQEILAPLLRQEGLQVFTGYPEDGAGAGDVLLVEQEASPPPVAGAMVLLRRTQDPADGPDSSIYRYDRDGVIAAILRAARGEGAA